MPTQGTYAGLPSANETKAESRSDTLVKGALAHAKQSLSDMPEPTGNEMSKGEALAVAWTGLEALATTGNAIVYRSRKNGKVWIELLATDYDPANGLVPIQK